MNCLKKEQVSPLSPLPGDTSFEIELNRVPIAWDLEKGSFSFFGLDSALFWTDPSLVRTLAPLAEEVGVDLFRLLIAHSSSLGTGEDYHAMVSTLGEDFSDGFLAWGKAVSGAGWGTFELLDYDPIAQQATVVVHNPWELSMQRNLPTEKRWGCPFLQGKIIGIFSHAYNTPCWAEDNCHYDPEHARVTFRVYPSSSTIQKELKKLRQKRMLSRERALAKEVEGKTHDLERARKDLENYSKTLEVQVSERTSELEKLLNLLEAEKRKLKVMAETDPLTGLNNRRAFFKLGSQLINKYVDRNEPVSVVALDLDHFKQINDTYGHAAGDQVLVELAGLMKKMFRSSDIIARTGGEEFAIICSNADFLANREPLERFRETIEQNPILFGGQEIKVTISLGTTIGQDGDDLNGLMKKADRLLYLAKESGRNCIVAE